jgi:hypothetical protein
VEALSVSAPIDLAAARRRRLARDERERLPLVVQQVDDTVNIIVGSADDGAELWIDPDLADEVADELRRVAAAARARANEVRRG